MNAPARPQRPDHAPALSRLLAECALSRAALGACAVPLALVDAGAKGRAVTYVNAAFEAFFGYREGEALGRPLAALLFRDDDALAQRLLAESPLRWQVGTWDKHGDARPVEVAVTAIRDSAGKLSQWIVAFSDCSELERLRAEVEALRTLAAAGLGVRLEPVVEPACGTQEPRVEIAATDELHADGQAAGVLQQR